MALWRSPAARPAIFFLLPVIGAVLAMMRHGTLRRVQLSWVLALGGLWFVVMFTGVLNMRYQFVFEPFCVIYVFLGFDVLCDLVVASLRTCKWHDNRAGVLHSSSIENA